MVIQLKKLIEFQIYYLVIMEVFIDLLHFPNIIRYLLDVNMLVIILFMATEKRNDVKNRAHQGIIRYSYIYMIALIVISVLQINPIGQIVWGVRNNFFYILFFVACIKFLKIDDVTRILNNAVKFHILNIICYLYEFFVLDVRADYLGGMFGVEPGCNGYLNIYLIVICTYVTGKYVQNKARLANALWIILTSIIMAAFSELKIFYLELVIIVMLIILLNRKNAKIAMLTLCSIAFLFVGIQVLSATNNMSMAYISSVENMVEYNSRDDYGYGDIRIARLTSIAQINNIFFGKELGSKIWGYGLGACEESKTFEWANSEFADKFGYLQYRNLSSAMNYLETGMLGLLAFNVFFVIIFLNVYRFRKKSEEKQDDYVHVFTQIMCILAIICIWYNSSIRREIAYLLFFALACSYIRRKDYEPRSI